MEPAIVTEVTGVAAMSDCSAWRDRTVVSEIIVVMVPHRFDREATQYLRIRILEYCTGITPPKHRGCTGRSVTLIPRIISQNPGCSGVRGSTRPEFNPAVGQQFRVISHHLHRDDVSFLGPGCRSRERTWLLQSLTGTVLRTGDWVKIGRFPGLARISRAKFT